MIKFPYYDEATGYTLQEYKFYGFGDSGELTGNDFATREGCITNAKFDYCEISTEPADLGVSAIAVLSGREYVDELIKRKLIDENGKWL